MKPPICELCDEAFEPAEGGLVRFAGSTSTADEDPTLVRHPEDTGWFCPRHLSDAQRLAGTHTLASALAVMRGPAPKPRSLVVHSLENPVQREQVQARFERTSAALAELLGIEGAPTHDRETSTSAGPDPREAATTTSLRVRTTWAAAQRTVWLEHRDIVWDAPRRPRGGDLMQGTLTLAVDGVRIDASYDADAKVCSLREAGTRPAEASPVLDALLEALRAD
ncbi:MAG: hypothetical protein AAGA54_37310 [Myxococcota bacterium]